MKKYLKRITSILLTVVLLLTAAPLSGFTGLDFSISASAASYSGTCGENLTWSLDTETGELVISGTGAMDNYASAIYIPWYADRLSIKTVTIEEGVTSIGNRAFYECSNLVSVSIPTGVTSIGYQSFYNCIALLKATIPEGVISISNGAFMNCMSLTSVTIPSSITNINVSVFESCTGLKSVLIPDSVTDIGNYAF